MKKLDLHIHSYYSDGTYTPEEIIDKAIENNVGTISLTDHNTIKGLNEMKKLAKDKGIKFISGVEIDAVEKGINYHILAYGINPDNEDFKEFIEYNEVMLEEFDIDLIKKMEKDYEHISLEEYLSYSYNRKKGGWKTLHYLTDKKMCQDLQSGLLVYSKYNHSSSEAKFPELSIVLRKIKEAGGKAVLAHPGRVIKKDSVEEFKNQIYQLVNEGIDGIECYYPSHTEEITEACVSICNEKDLLITCGSDCHGEFEKTKIGHMNIGIDKLNLKDLF